MNVIDTTKRFCYLVKETFFYPVLNVPPFLQVWTLRLFSVSCFPNLNVKSFSLNESSMSPASLETFLHTTDMFSPPSSSFLSSRGCRRDSADILSWWGRRDVTGSSYYLSLHLSIFLCRDRYLVWLFDTVIYSSFLLDSLILFLSIFFF